MTRNSVLSVGSTLNHYKDFNGNDSMTFNAGTVATPSIAESIKLYRDVLGATKIGEPFDLPAQGVKVCFIDTPTAQIELIEPFDETSPITGFLAKNPKGGQHHVCFEVADIHAAIAEMRAKGVTILGTG